MVYTMTKLIFLIVSAAAITVVTSTLQHHADVNNDALMKLVERVDRQELEIKNLVRKLNRQEQKMKKLEAEVAAVRLENKQLKSDIQKDKVKLDGQTTMAAEKYRAKFNHGKHSITKRQVQQGNLASSVCVQGPQGPPGRDGRDGFQGPPGPKGESGSLLLDHLKQMLRQLGVQVGMPTTTGLPANASHGGAVYTRWGRTTCLTHSKLLYKGIIAGTYYSKTGGGSNYLCLPQTPEWGKYHDGGQGTGSYIHGVEYELIRTKIFSTSNAGGQDLLDHDAPCAVCHTQTRPSHVMIPAKKTCPAGWTTEYNGYLVSALDSHQRTEFVCLDEAPEVVAGGHENKDGALMYTAEVKCGPLTCPPYVDGRELACVVCTK